MKAFQQDLGSLHEVFHEPEIVAALEDIGSVADQENIRKVLALDVGQEVTFDSGVQWKRLPDDTPKTFSIICHRGKMTPCKYCGRDHTKLCDYPVKRGGKEGTCDIPLCDRCTTKGGPNIDYCRPHAKLMRTGATAR